MIDRDWQKDWLDVAALCMLEKKLYQVQTKYGILTFTARRDRDDRVSAGYWLDKAREVLGQQNHRLK